MRYFTVATAGHVDHGKTSLLKALTGIDPDRLKEEKERQMTTDLGFAHLSHDDIVVGFVDVPGHGKFLKNMLAGVGGIDMALLVVAADEGPMPQTIQHVRILSYLGVPNVLVALNKVDTCDGQRTQQSQEEIVALLKEYGLNQVGVIPVSATKEIGIAELEKAIVQLCSSSEQRINGKTVFFPIDRVFSKSGFGTVVTGTLVEGELKLGDQVLVGNKNIRAKIRRLESFGQTVDTASAGQRVAVNLASKETLERGDVLLSEKHPAADVLVVSLTQHGKNTDLKILEGQDVRIYHGTSEVVGHVRFVTSNLAKIALVSPLVARLNDKLIIRMPDDTICGGGILVLDPPRWLTKEKIQRLAEVLSKGDFAKAAVSYLQLCPQEMLPVSDLAKILPSHIDNDNIVVAANYVLTKNKQELLFNAILANLPNSFEMLRSKILPAVKREVFQAIIQQLIALGKVEVKNGQVVLSGQNWLDSPTDSKLAVRIKEILLQNICIEIDEIAHLLEADSKVIRSIMIDLSKTNEAYIVAYEYAALRENIDKCHRVMASLWQKKRDIAPGEFREALGVSRKYAMALLSYFDDQQITRRLPSGRVLMKAPSN